MITSIVLTNTHKIGIDSNGKFMVGDTKVSIKEVPFVRYRFNKFGETELNYIGKMKNIFKHSSHMVEITISEDTPKILDAIEEKLQNIIRFIYVPVVDSHVTDGFDESTLKLVELLDDYDFDRVMLKDNTTTLHAVAAAKLKKEIADTIDVNVKDIGICQSPLSFNGEACLTAVKARELSAEYAENDEVALPSANHECMNCCGCIRYHVIDSDVAAPVSKTTKGTKKKTSNKNKEPKKNNGTAEQKEVKSKGLTFIQF